MLMYPLESETEGMPQEIHISLEEMDYRIRIGQDSELGFSWEWDMFGGFSLNEHNLTSLSYVARRRRNDEPYYAKFRLLSDENSVSDKFVKQLIVKPSWVAMWFRDEAYQYNLLHLASIPRFSHVVTLIGKALRSEARPSDRMREKLARAIVMVEVEMLADLTMQSPA
ncbi:hypothetical protein BDV95DRAFT_563355 [Massariosphaeria phaeospora]|uniref:Uncharacterized protein n=1 Tax=Massariosphaeria phaeospora TaxID=100035 RepID=A0A7C8IDW9_9PLEO|nr:hypothetical protein BDV95DRAFT_563355 [Massariosphaeria phaeospora]